MNRNVVMRGGLPLGMKSTPVKIVPSLDVRHGRLTKGMNFAGAIDLGDPAEYAARYQADGADELAFFDVAASPEGRSLDLETLRRVVGAVEIPVAAGGGLRSVADVEAVLAAGAKKATLATVAFQNPDVVKEAVARFGSESIAVALDANRNVKMHSQREVFLMGGRKATGVDAVEFAKRMADLGVGSLLPTSIVADGTSRGFDLDLIFRIATATGVPTTASGGAGKLVHFLEAVREAHASALLAASSFHFHTFTVRQVKVYLTTQGVAVLNPPKPVI